MFCHRRKKSIVYVWNFIILWEKTKLKSKNWSLFQLVKYEIKSWILVFRTLLMWAQSIFGWASPILRHSQLLLIRHFPIKNDGVLRSLELFSVTLVKICNPKIFCIRSNISKSLVFFNLWEYILRNENDDNLKFYPFWKN